MQVVSVSRLLRLASLLLVARPAAMGSTASKGDTTNTMSYKLGEEPAPALKFTEEELRAKLSEEEFNVTQNKGKHILHTSNS